MRLIINADDLGFSKGINYGIYDAYKYGIVRSATLMMNMRYTDHAIELLKDTEIGLGIHLNITAGKPLLEHRYLIDENGLFKRNHEFDQATLEEVENEWTAQIESAYEKGLCLTHLDSHHHIHMMDEVIFKLSKKLALKYNLKMRCDRKYHYMTETLLEGLVTTEGFDQTFHNKEAYMTHLIQIILDHKDLASFEIMTHPGFLCGNLYGKDAYREMRMVENSVLTCQPLLNFIKEQDITLIHFGQL